MSEQKLAITSLFMVMNRMAKIKNFDKHNPEHIEEMEAWNKKRNTVTSVHMDKILETDWSDLQGVFFGYKCIPSEFDGNEELWWATDGAHVVSINPLRFYSVTEFKREVLGLTEEGE